MNPFSRRALRGLTLCLALAPLAASAEEAKIVGRAGPISYSEAEAQALIATLPPPAREALARDPSQAAPLLRGKLLDRLVLDDLAKAGFDKRDDVTQRLALARESMLIELYLDAHVTAPPEFPTETEARAYYDGNKATFIPPKRYKLSQIFVADTSDAKTDPKLEDVRNRLKAKGANFALIAHEMSDNKAEAANGGDLGWVGEPNLRPEIRDALTRAKAGDITPPIRIQDGFHIVLVENMVAAGQEPVAFDMVKDTLRAELRRRRIAAERQAFVESLLKANPVTIDDAVLTEAVKTAK